LGNDRREPEDQEFFEGWGNDSGCGTNLEPEDICPAKRLKSETASFGTMTRLVKGINYICFPSGSSDVFLLNPGENAEE